MIVYLIIFTSISFGRNAKNCYHYTSKCWNDNNYTGVMELDNVPDI